MWCDVVGGKREKRRRGGLSSSDGPEPATPHLDVRTTSSTRAVYLFDVQVRAQCAGAVVIDGAREAPERRKHNTASGTKSRQILAQVQRGPKQRGSGALSLLISGERSAATVTGLVVRPSTSAPLLSRSGESGRLILLRNLMLLNVLSSHVHSPGSDLCTSTRRGS